MPNPQPPIITEAHTDKHTFTEYTEVDAHVQRKQAGESREFTHNKRLMVRQLDLPCFICKSRTKREVHHIHEWSLWNKLDPEMVLDTLHCFDPYGYTRQMGDKPIESPDDIRNLLILCGECEIEGVVVPGGHHRGRDAGVHDETFPTWIAQRAVKPGESITKPIEDTTPHGHH